MALVDFDQGEQTTLRPGDVIFHHKEPPAAEVAQSPPEEIFPTHSCIYVGLGEEVQGPAARIHVRVRGVPAYRGSVTGGGSVDFLGDCTTGKAGAWFANLAGQVLRAEPAHLDHVVILSKAHIFERSQLEPQCAWDKEQRVSPSRPIKTILGEHPLFERGSCSHYVEYLYERSGLDLVAEVTRDPKNPGRIYPAAQIAAFWGGEYPLVVAPWDVRLARFPTCLEVLPRRTDR